MDIKKTPYGVHFLYGKIKLLGKQHTLTSAPDSLLLKFYKQDTKRVTASTCSRDKSQCHCQWPLSLPQLSTTFKGTILMPYSFTPRPVGVGELLYAQAHCLSG